MNRDITYNNGHTLSYCFDVTRRQLEKDIIELSKKGYTDIQVIKITVKKCTCKCGDEHETYHRSIDKNFTEFIENLQRNREARGN